MNQFIKDGSIRLGGVAHRFQHDAAVDAYCKAQGYLNWGVDNDGTVWADNYAGGAMVPFDIETTIVGFIF